MIILTLVRMRKKRRARAVLWLACILNILHNKQWLTFVFRVFGLFWCCCRTVCSNLFHFQWARAHARGWNFCTFSVVVPASGLLPSSEHLLFFLTLVCWITYLRRCDGKIRIICVCFIYVSLNGSHTHKKTRTTTAKQKKINSILRHTHTNLQHRSST